MSYIVMYFVMLCRDYTRHDPSDLDMDDRGIDVGMH